jgi:hypothetical protein
MDFRNFLFFCFLCFSSTLFARAVFEEPWGKDVELKIPAIQEATPPKPSIGIRIAEAVIRFHQQVISPVDGPRSHFRPSSSQYMRAAMQRYGFFRGFVMGCDRLLRENDEKWVYRTIQEGGKTFKYDPAFLDKSKSVN